MIGPEPSNLQIGHWTASMEVSGPPISLAACRTADADARAVASSLLGCSLLRRSPGAMSRGTSGVPGESAAPVEQDRCNPTVASVEPLARQPQPSPTSIRAGLGRVMETHSELPELYTEMAGWTSSAM